MLGIGRKRSFWDRLPWNQPSRRPITNPVQNQEQTLPPLVINIPGDLLAGKRIQEREKADWGQRSRKFMIRIILWPVEFVFDLIRQPLVWMLLLVGYPLAVWVCHVDHPGAVPYFILNGRHCVLPLWKQILSFELKFHIG